MCGEQEVIISVQSVTLSSNSDWICWDLLSVNETGFSCSLSDDEGFEGCEMSLSVPVTWEHGENGGGGERPGVYLRI